MNRLVNAVWLRDVIFFGGALALVMTGLAGLLGIAPAGQLLFVLSIGLALIAALDIGFMYGARFR